MAAISGQDRRPVPAMPDLILLPDEILDSTFRVIDHGPRHLPIRAPDAQPVVHSRPARNWVSHEIAMDATRPSPVPRGPREAGRDTVLTTQERRLGVALRILAALFGLAVFAYLLPGLGVFGPTLRAFYVEAPFVTNSVVKIGTLSMLALIASSDVRRYRVCTVLLILGHVISELAMICFLLWGDTERIVMLGPPIGTRPVRDLLWFAIVMDGLILFVLAWMYGAADRARYGLRYFAPT